MNRLETLVLTGMDIPLSAVRSQIASALDIVVQLGRLRDKSRKVLEIDEVIGIEKGEIVLEPLYLYQEKGQDQDGRVVGKLVEVNSKIQHEEKLKAAGLDL